MRKGFTLVELSIVLVIIGLLIGGILVGQSLIESVKIQGVIRQVQQYDAAVLLFDSKFRGLPGDNNKLFAGGDNDGFIEDSDDANPFNGLFDNETANFWKNLSETGFKPDGIIYSADVPTWVEQGVNTPTLEGFEDISVVAQRQTTIHIGYVPVGNFNNSYYFTKGNTFGTGNTIYGSFLGYPSDGGGFTPIQALAIDKKIDDGLGGQGLVLGDLSNSCIDIFAVDSPYLTDIEGEGCGMYIAIGASYN